MPSTFNVFFMGNHASIDPTEGNETAENASVLVGQSYGSAANPLHQNVQTFSPGSTGYGGGDTTSGYDQDNFDASETFTIDGGSEQTFDATAVYNVTLTYSDGTTATVTGVVFQDTSGNTYLAPEYSANSDQTALEAKAIESISLDSLSGSTWSGMTATRLEGDYVTPDGTVAGTSGDDTIDASYGDTDGDVIDDFDGDDDIIQAGGGNDFVTGGAGNDSIEGGSGNDELHGDNSSTNLIGNGDFSNGGSGWTVTGTSDGVGGGRYLNQFDNSSGTLTWDTPLTGLQDGPGAQGAGQINFDLAWSDSIAGSSLSSVFEVRIDGVVYARVTTPDGTSGSQATVEYLNGASGTPSTITEGNAISATGYVPISVDLPPSVPDTGTLSFVADATGGADDFSLDNVQLNSFTNSGTGNDTIDGGSGSDTIYGDAGDDQLYGGTGGDTLYGGDGSDTIDGGSGDDTFFGGAGEDVFVLTTGGDDDTASDFDSSDNGQSVTAFGITRSGMTDQIDTSGLTDVGNGSTNQDGIVTADEVVVTGGGGSDQVLTFPSGETLTVPDGTIDTTSAQTQFASLVAMGMPPCFATGTRILTPLGERLVDDLWPGDQVITADHGPQTLRWIGRRDVDFTDPSNRRARDDKPVLIKAGALGDGQPTRDLVVSPQHRMVLSGKGVVNAFGTSEVFAIAKSLTSLPKVRTMAGKLQVSYFALLFDRHEVIFAEGAPTESFRPGPLVTSSFSADQLEEIHQIYPCLASDPETAPGPPARMLTKRPDVERFLEAKFAVSRDKSTRADMQMPALTHKFASTSHRN